MRRGERDEGRESVKRGGKTRGEGGEREEGEREEGEKESRRVRGWRILGHSREISCFSSWKWLKISAGKYRINKTQL